jgi:hypothetical protein
VARVRWRSGRRLVSDLPQIAAYLSSFRSCFVRVVLSPIRDFSFRMETRNSTEFVADAGEESMKLRKTKNHRIPRRVGFTQTSLVLTLYSELF